MFNTPCKIKPYTDKSSLVINNYWMRFFVAWKCAYKSNERLKIALISSTIWIWRYGAWTIYCEIHHLEWKYIHTGHCSRDHWLRIVLCMNNEVDLKHRPGQARPVLHAHCLIFSSEFQLSREKWKQYVCKTACVCWGARNTQTKWKSGNGELSSY